MLVEEISGTSRQKQSPGRVGRHLSLRPDLRITLWEKNLFG